MTDTPSGGPPAPAATPSPDSTGAIDELLAEARRIAAAIAAATAGQAPAPAAAATATAAEELQLGAPPPALPSLAPPLPIFDELVEMVLKSEGGFVDNPNDPGGATNYGITIGTLSSVLGRRASKDEVAAMTRDFAKKIYVDRYWMPIRGNELPTEVAAHVFDMAVNSGIAAAGKLLQRSLTSLGMAVSADGKIGAQTIDAVQKLAARPGLLEELLVEIATNRSTFYQRLKGFQFFGKGWLRRLERVALFVGRVAARRALGV